MEDFTLSELGLFIGTIGGVITTIIFAIQKSKCDTISCCGCKIHRKVPPEQPPNDQRRPEGPLLPQEIEERIQNP
jgi:hypothetical protein